MQYKTIAIVMYMGKGLEWDGFRQESFEGENCIQGMCPEAKNGVRIMALVPEGLPVLLWLVEPG